MFFRLCQLDLLEEGRNLLGSKQNEKTKVAQNAVMSCGNQSEEGKPGMTNKSMDQSRMVCTAANSPTKWKEIALKVQKV